MKTGRSSTGPSSCGWDAARDGRRSPRSRNIAGTRTRNPAGSAGVQPVLVIFVGGCDLNTTENDILSYCAPNNVGVKLFESFASVSYWYNTFQMPVTVPDRAKTLNAHFGLEWFVFANISVRKGTEISFYPKYLCSHTVYLNIRVTP